MLRIRLDAVTAEKAELEKEYDFLRTVIIPPKLEEAGMKSFKLESGKGIRVQDEVFVNVKAENFEAFKNWLIEQGEAGIIKETVHPSTLKSFITGRIKDGKEYPMAEVNVLVVPKARFY